MIKNINQRVMREGQLYSSQNAALSLCSQQCPRSILDHFTLRLFVITLAFYSELKCWW